jgi:glycosyltransferase involved in cell wall biosynthesis
MVTDASAPDEGRAPLVSIGLLVYNGYRHIERALDTLLAQDFRDFELIISDDASTDGTQAICERYAARDARIRYVTGEFNRGAAWNFNRVGELARADLFVWAAQDDEWHPQFLARCVAVLQAQPDVVCCYSVMQPIDDESLPHGEPVSVDCDDASKRARWNHTLLDWRTNALIYGVMRTAAFRRTRGMGAFMCSDFVFVCELILHGKAVVVPEPLHRKRMLRNNAWKSYDQMLRGLEPSPERRRGKRFFIRLWVLRELLAGLRHAKLPASEERDLAYEAKRHYWTSRGWRFDGVEFVWTVLGPRRTDWVRRQLGRPQRV